MSKKLSSKLNWSCSEISYQLRDDEKKCDCKELDFTVSSVYWMMCPDCQRIWVKKFKEGKDMASQNKKNKARNSFMYDGGEKERFIKLKRLMFFRKKDRIANKKLCEETP